MLLALINDNTIKIGKFGTGTEALVKVKSIIRLTERIFVAILLATGA